MGDLIMVKAEEFTKVLKEEISSNPAIRGANYEIVRDKVDQRLRLSCKQFDEILGYMLNTGRLENVWLFTGGRQAKICHENMDEKRPFDSIEEAGEGIRYQKLKEK